MKTIQYTITTSPFKQSTFLFQLFIAIGIPFGALLIFLWFIKAWEGMILVGLLLGLSAIMSLLLYGKYTLHYIIDERGVRLSPNASQRKKNQFINQLTIIAGLVAKKPTVMAAGILASTNQNQYFAWKDMHQIRIYRKHMVLTNQHRQKLILVYPKKHKQDVIDAVRRFGKENIYE